MATSSDPRRDPEPQVPINVAVEPPPRERIYDYYIAPPRVAPSPLHEVAAALAPLSNDLLALAGQQQQQENKADYAKGTADAYMHPDSVGDSEALQSGLLPHDKSPAYLNGAAATTGVNDALRLQQSIEPDFTNLDKTNPDPAAFDKWFLGRVGDGANPNLRGNAYYAKAYGNGVARLHAELSAKYAQQRSDTVKVQAQENFSAALGNIITVSTPQGPALGTETALSVDVPDLANQLGQVRQFSIQHGLDKAYADKATIDTVTTQAVRYRTPELLDTLRQLPVNPNDQNGAKLGETEYGIKAVDEAQKTIKTSILQDRERWLTQTKLMDEKASNAAQFGVVQQWAKGNINYQPTQEELQAISKTKPEFQAEMAKIREGIVKGTQPVEDPQKVMDLNQRLMTGQAGPGDIVTAMSNGTITSATSLKSAFETLNLAEKYGQSGGANRILEDPAAKRWIGTIEGLTANPKWAQNIVGNPRVTVDGQRAIFEFSQALMRHSIENPNEGPIERQQFIQKLGSAVVGGISNQDSENFNDHKYTTPGGVQGMLPGAAAQPALPTPTPATPAPAPASPAAPQGQRQGLIETPDQARAALLASPQPPDVAQLQGSLSPAMWKQLQSAASQLGKTPQDLINSLWGEAHGQQPQAPANGQPAQAAPEKHSELETPQAQPVSFTMPGGGRVDIHGVAPDAAEHIQRMISLLGTDQQAGADLASHAANLSRVAQIDRIPAVKEMIERIAKETGFDANKLKAMVSIESGGRPSADTGSYQGLLQLSKGEMAKYGNGGDRHDAEANLRAGVNSLRDKEAKFKTQFGRTPSSTELYLMHQQGEAGLRAHEANPDDQAWKNMLSTREGQEKGERWAKAAIWGNVPSDMRHLFGSVDNITSKEFMAVWAHKVEGIPYATALREGTKPKHLASAD
jgi:hypothetical protein